MASTTTLNNRLNVSNLACIRGERILFKNLSFALNSGKLLYVQGENGSGKTTLLRTLCGLFLPTAGDVLWNNQEIKALAEDYQGQVLYIGHLAGIKEDLTAVENMQFSIALAGFSVDREQVINALTALGIARCADLPSRVLSQGQKRRIALAQLWLQNDPKQMPLWILDEPFTALDANMIDQLTQQIERYVNDGGIVVFTSHQAPNFDRSVMQDLQLGHA
ncbi:MAG: heme ABC transporter ATP-binding protein CcmA [Methylophilaceae bacterium]|nr:MAG: heme ABC transporter ATP-binding protein CcmA [Methylophilaceae bacterium]